MNCIITVHLDNRLRMWNIQDGKCFNLSSYNIFEDSGEIIEIFPLNENSGNRFIACLSKLLKFY